MIVDATSYAAQARSRLWNLMLGGSEAYEQDRWLLQRLQSIVPGIAHLARNESAFVDRFWRYAAGVRGIRQVVHIGAPLPAGYPPHKALAQPGQVVYVEGDDLLARKGEAWMAESSVDVIHVDPLDVTAMVKAISGKIYWLEPAAVIAPGVLSWVGTAQARTWVQRLVEALPPDSILASTHLFDPQLPDSVVPIEQMLQRLDPEVGAGFFRRRADVEGLFAGLTLESPGVSLATDWWPNGPRLRPAGLVDQLLAAVVVTVPRIP